MNARSKQPSGLVYRSSEMEAAVSLALRIAPSNVPVLITGPSGSGKDCLAELVRANSTRNEAPFVVVNSSALPPALLEAELFGAETATGQHKGRFEQADGGTLFLDEIGSLSVSGQAALLRVLQTGSYSTGGGATTRQCDVRLITATHENLPRLIAEGRFREDLYYRLSVVELVVPALRDRLDDLDVLVDHFLTEYGVPPDSIDEATRTALRGYTWPGNVRELENRLQRAALVRTGPQIGLTELGLNFERALTARATGGNERQDLEVALARAGGIVTRAALELGISRQALYRRLDRAGMRVERRLRR